MKLLKIFRERVKMNLVNKRRSYLGFSAGGVKFTPPPYEIGLSQNLSKISFFGRNFGFLGQNLYN